MFLIFPLRIEATLAQTAQPRQTPTVTPTKPVNKTPTVTERSRSASPTLKPVTLANNNVETPTEETTEETAEPLDPEEAEQKANDLDNKISPKNQNPFSKPDIDKLLTQQFNDDMWRIMRGALPCLETTSSCLEQLQNKSVADSPLLTRISHKRKKSFIKSKTKAVYLIHKQQR